MFNLKLNYLLFHHLMFLCPSLSHHFFNHGHLFFPKIPFHPGYLTPCDPRIQTQPHDIHNCCLILNFEKMV